MLKLQCLLFLLKQSYIHYYVTCLTVPLKHDFKDNFNFKIILKE